ncbi:MAG: hypothetical protein ACK59M_05840 [Pseudomonadota bacterium]
MTPRSARPHRGIRRFLLLAAILLSPLPASASGTLGGGSSADPYALGKRVYLQRIACSACPAAGGVGSADAARSLLDRIARDEFALKPREQRAVVAYLKRRWRLQ